MATLGDLQIKNNNFPLAYACYNKDLNIRLQSTSGGIFTLIASYVIQQLEGVVFGAGFDSDYNVHHMWVDNVQDIEKLRGSKYSQSKVGDAFKDVYKFLNEGRSVLFTGTPCQVNGLKYFLNKEYNNLLCMDFVCHGVASRGIWKDYVSWLRKKGIITNIVFKNKTNGWKKWYFMVEYTDHKYSHRGGMNRFMRSYLRYCNIRPSCYECTFKGLRHNSELTISDCWGIGEQNLEINDDRGLSALLIQNERGANIFENIKSNIRYIKYPAQELMEGNWTAFKSVYPHKDRQNFFALYAEKGGMMAINKYFKPTIKNWLVYYKMRLQGKER